MWEGGVSDPRDGRRDRFEGGLGRDWAGMCRAEVLREAGGNMGLGLWVQRELDGVEGRSGSSPRAETES